MWILTLLLACAPKPPSAVSAAPQPASLPDAPLADGTLPRPFTAEQIRDALPTGSHIALSVTDASGKTVEQRWTFLDCTADATSVASEIWAGGALVEDEGTGRQTWADLRDHAAFPAAAATRTDTTVDTPLGHFDAWLYTVNAPGEDGVPQVSRFWFARTLPGPPVLLTVERAGVEVFRMAQVRRDQGAK